MIRRFLRKLPSWTPAAIATVSVGALFLALPFGLAQSLPSLSQLDQPVDSVVPQMKDLTPEALAWHRKVVRQSLVAVMPTAKPAPTSSTSPKAPAKTAAKSIPDIELRVAIAKGADTLAIASSTSADIHDSSGKFLGEMPAQEVFYAQPKDQSVTLGKWQAPILRIRPTQGGYVFVGEHWYRSEVMVILEPQGLLAVNAVSLEAYLPSVVGSEMPSYWPAEALKAQAVAARSYALAQYIRPASDYYQLGSTEAWQVYKGLDGETDSTRKAVEQTLGQILSYNGGIVDSLYAATDEIVIEAHGGIGMSQHGANKLAAQGYDYLHILGAYYPGTGLASLEAEN